MTLAVPSTRRLPDLSALPPRTTLPRVTNATLVGRDEATPNLARFRIRPDDGPVSCAAGQYVPIALADGAIAPRPYSIASRPGQRELELLISLVPGGQLTSRLFRVAMGTRLHVGRARGLFRLDPADERDHVLIATGSGVAPLLAMVWELAGRSSPPRTTFLHGARTRAELAVTAGSVPSAPDWLSYQPVLSRPRAADAWQGRTGHVTAWLEAMCSTSQLEPSRTVAYLCGNPAMIEESTSLLSSAGLAASAVRVERFSQA